MSNHRLLAIEEPSSALTRRFRRAAVFSTVDANVAADRLAAGLVEALVIRSATAQSVLPGDPGLASRGRTP